jgi:hypothetical protein
MHVLVVPARSRSKKNIYLFLTGGVTIPRLFLFCGGDMSGVKYQLLSVDGVDYLHLEKPLYLDVFF